MIEQNENRREASQNGKRNASMTLFLQSNENLLFWMLGKGLGYSIG